MGRRVEGEVWRGSCKDDSQDCRREHGTLPISEAVRAQGLVDVHDLEGRSSRRGFLIDDTLAMVELLTTLRPQRTEVHHISFLSNVYFGFGRWTLAMQRRRLSLLRYHPG